MAESDDFYIELAGDARQLIQEFGKQFTVRAKPTFDDVDLDVSEGVTRQVWGLVSDQNFLQQFDANQKWADGKFLVLDADAAPQSGEDVSIDGEWHPMTKINAIKPADIPVIYVLGLSR